MTNQTTHEKDIEAIKQAVMGYIEAWYQGDAKRGVPSLHPDLAKRIVRVDEETGTNWLEAMSAAFLAKRWDSGDGKATPLEEQMKEITVLDVHHGMASVKLEAKNWVDYMHLAKYDGEWVIVNILWEVKP